MTPAFALLHAAHDLSWTSWHFEPTVVAGALLVVGLYFYGVGMTPGAFPVLRVAAFLFGSVIMFVALVSPLDVAAERLLSLHMLQHVGLTTIGPPLVVLGLPPALLRRLFASAAMLQGLRTVANPFVAATLFIVNMWLWHVPFMYEAALNYTVVHATMHVAFMATGLLFWWPAIQPLPEAFNFGTAGRLAYLFVTGFPMGILALLLLSAQAPIYGFYEEAPRLWGISPLTDQQVAGVIMGSLGEIASFSAFTIIFFKLMSEEESAPARASASPDPSP